MSEKLTVNGLTPLELRELENLLGKSSVEEVGSVPADTKFPEPMAISIATITLSLAALNALAIIVTRPRKSGARELRIERTEKKLIITLKEDVSISESPPADVVEKIGKTLAIDLKSLGLGLGNKGT